MNLIWDSFTVNGCYQLVQKHEGSTTSMIMSPSITNTSTDTTELKSGVFMYIMRTGMFIVYNYRWCRDVLDTVIICYI